MVLFPCIMVILNENILRTQRKNSAIADLLRIIRNLILPLLVIFLALTQVLGLNPDSSPIRLLQSLLLLATIHLFLSIVNLVFFVGARADSWQAKVPKLMRDLVRGFMILIGTAIVLSVVWKLDLGNLITALGVSSIVIGLALQDTLGNLFSGITLLFERPFRLGDWIKVGDSTGKVTEVNWRAVHLTTRELELIVVPNSILAKEMFKNFNKPARLHVELVEVGFSYNDPPNKVKSVLLETAIATKGVLDQPKPEIQTVNYNNSSVDYKVRLFLADYSKVPQIRDEFISRIWYAAKRHGLEIPFPIRTVYHQPIQPTQSGLEFSSLAPRLQAIPFFSTVEPEDLQDFIQDAKLLSYGEKEPIIACGDRNVQLHLLLSGSVQMSIGTDEGREKKVIQLEEGEFFGTSALMNSNDSDISVRAITDTEVLALKTESVHILLARSPKLSQLLGEIIEERRKILEAARGSSRLQVLPHL